MSSPLHAAIAAITASPGLKIGEIKDACPQFKRGTIDSATRNALEAKQIRSDGDYPNIKYYLPFEVSPTLNIDRFRKHWIGCAA